MMLNALTNLEELAKYKDERIHEACIDMIASLYIQEDIKSLGEESKLFIIQNLT